MLTGTRAFTTEPPIPFPDEPNNFAVFFLRLVVEETNYHLGDLNLHPPTHVVARTLPKSWR